MVIPKIYKNKNLSALKGIAVKHFNKFIRERDKDKPCISCGKYGDGHHAGHYYSAGSHSALRFTETNVFSQCVHCNYFKHGNLINYTNGIIERIGYKEYKKLVDLHDVFKRQKFKWDRFSLIKVILKYKELNK